MTAPTAQNPTAHLGAVLIAWGDLAKKSPKAFERAVNALDWEAQIAHGPAGATRLITMMRDAMNHPELAGSPATPRDFLEALEWDGKKRLRSWLQRACFVGVKSKDLGLSYMEYLERVGKWMLQGMVARVLDAHASNDHVVVLQGPSGVGKSRLLQALAGVWHFDSGVVLSKQASLIALDGCWLYELNELDAFSQEDAANLKRFVTASSVAIRVPYEKRTQRVRPAAVTFVGTTSSDTFLTEDVGNRRFWPVRITSPVDLLWVANERDQLFAEAVVRHRKGKRMAPTAAEFKAYFEPQMQRPAVAAMSAKKGARHG